MRHPTPNGRRYLCSAAVVVTAVVGLSSCSQLVPNSSTGGTSLSTSDPNAPVEPLTDVPAAPDDARADLRRRLVGAWEPLLKASGLRFSWAHFGVDEHSDGNGWWNGVLTVSFGTRPQEQWGEVESRMARAAESVGWTQAGVSHGLNLRSSTFHLSGGCAVSTGCSYSIETAPTTTRVSQVPGGFEAQIAELEPYRDPRSVSS